MGNFAFNVPSLGNKFIDYRQQILGDSFNWSWVRPLTEVRYLTIHHAAGPDNQTPDDIASYHVNSRGWGGIGYHFVISQNGTVYYVGDLTTARAHVLNMNHLALGICLIGTFIEGKVPTSSQINSAHELCSQLLFRTPEIPGIDGWEDVVGHQDLSPTQCPGDSWPNWRARLVSALPVNPNQRQLDITKLYQVVLGRDPDQTGLNYYYQSKWTIEEIRKILTESTEHQEILNKSKKLKDAQTRAQTSLTSLSQAYQQVAEITKI